MAQDPKTRAEGAPSGDQGGRTTTYTYAIDDEMRWDASSGLITTYTFDERNRKVVVSEPGGIVTRYDYDEARHLILVTDSDGHVSEFLDLPDMRLVSTRDPETGRISHASVPARRNACVTYTYCAPRGCVPDHDAATSERRTRD
jgi:YD repeat-containing protein